MMGFLEFIVFMLLTNLMAIAVVWDKNLIRAAVALTMAFIFSGLALVSIGSWVLGAFQVLVGASAVAIMAMYAASLAVKEDRVESRSIASLAATALAALGLSLGLSLIYTPGVFTNYTSPLPTINEILFSDIGLVLVLFFLLVAAIASASYLIKEV
jgi:NADH:ubiquinone oxidoreductase subunit 6 (subunit J)